jgi:tetratricopeptide (TPR) repeat protein/CHAT domain-containing protein
MLREEAKRRLRDLTQQIGQLYENGQFVQALDLASQARDLARRVLGDDHPYYAASLNNLGLLYKSVANYAAAEPLLREALAIRREVLGEEHSDFTTSLNNLGNLYRAMGNYAAAEPLLRQALEIDKRLLGEDHPDYATDLNSLAELYRSMGNYAGGEPLYHQVLKIRRHAQGEEHPEFATGLSNLAAFYDSTGNYAAAEPLYLKALEIRRKTVGEGHPDFATALNNLAAMYCLTGNYGAAEPLLQQALEITRRTLGDQHPDFAGSLSNMAHLYESVGKFTAAEPLLRQALETNRKALGDEHPDFATSLNNLGELYRSMGNYVGAEPLLKQALELNQRALGDEHPRVAAGINNLARLYRSMGNDRTAETLYRQAAAIYGRSSSEDHPDFAQTLNNLALLKADGGDHREAEVLLGRALEIRRKTLGEEHPAFAESLNNLAAFYEDLIGDSVVAEDLYRQALKVIRKAQGNNHPNVAACLNNLAFQRFSKGDYTGAEPLYEEAVGIYRRALGEEHPDFASSLNHLAAAYAGMGREGEALTLMQQAAPIQTKMIGQVFSISSERQRMTFVETSLGGFYLLLSIVLGHLADSKEAVRSAFDVVLQRKAIGAEALAAQRETVLGGRYPLLGSKLRELTTLRMQIAQKTLAGPGGTEGMNAHRQTLSAWNSRREELEGDLARQIPEMNIASKLLNAGRKSVAQSLPVGSALIEFVRSRMLEFEPIPARKADRYIAFVLRAGEADEVRMVDIGEAGAIDDMVGTFRRSITGEHENDRHEAAHGLSAAVVKVAQGESLRAAVFDPIVDALGGCTRLLVAPDGDLSRLPFEVLPTSNGTRLIDEYQISYLGSGRDVLRFGAAKSGPGMEPLVVADPNFDLGVKSVAALQAPPTSEPLGRQSRDFKAHRLHFERLPGTRIEGERIAEMLGVRPLLEDTALEETLKTCRSPRILHLATHGFFLSDQKSDSSRGRNKLGLLMAEASSTGGVSEAALENPLLRSGLALAGANAWLVGASPPMAAEDGILTAEDVSSLDLSDTELVVLSACETGLGEIHTGEGVYGLRRAFVLAGTKGLVMSLWKVPDQETGELMEDFYRRILIEEQSPASALLAARLELKKKYQDPLSWAAFIYEGDPALRVVKR